LLVDYYLVNRAKYASGSLDGLPLWNPVAFLAYAIGVTSTFFGPEWMVKALTGLIASVIAYFVLYHIARAMGFKPGHQQTAQDA